MYITSLQGTKRTQQRRQLCWTICIKGELIDLITWERGMVSTQYNWRGDIEEAPNLIPVFDY